MFEEFVGIAVAIFVILLFAKVFRLGSIIWTIIQLPFVIAITIVSFVWNFIVGLFKPSSVSDEEHEEVIESFEEDEELKESLKKYNDLKERQLHHEQEFLQLHRELQQDRERKLREQEDELNQKMQKLRKEEARIQKLKAQTQRAERNAQAERSRQEYENKQLDDAVQRFMSRRKEQDPEQRERIQAQYAAAARAMRNQARSLTHQDESHHEIELPPRF